MWKLPPLEYSLYKLCISANLFSNLKKDTYSKVYVVPNFSYHVMQVGKSQEGYLISLQLMYACKCSMCVIVPGLESDLRV